MELILIRHGQTLFNQLGLVQGWSDSPLTELGIQQAQKAAKILENEKIDYAYSSTSERAYDTCAIALGNRNLTITKDKRIKEFNFGIFEGTLDAYKMFYTRNVNFKEGKGFYEDCKPQGGDDTDMLLERFNNFIDEIYPKHKNDTVLLSSHGVALTAFVLQHFPQEIKEIYQGGRFFMKNAAVSKIVIDDQGWHLIYVNKED